MSLLPKNVTDLLEQLRGRAEETDLSKALASNFDSLPDRMRPIQKSTPETINQFWNRVQEDGPAGEQEKSELADSRSIGRAETYQSNIENYIGTASIPIGLIGPLRVNGLHASGDYFVPLATTEAALVASYGRGAEVSTKAGGITSAIIKEGVYVHLLSFLIT